MQTIKREKLTISVKLQPKYSRNKYAAERFFEMNEIIELKGGTVLVIFWIELDKHSTNKVNIVMVSIWSYFNK